MTAASNSRSDRRAHCSVVIAIIWPSPGRSSGSQPLALRCGLAAGPDELVHEFRELLLELRLALQGEPADLQHRAIAVGLRVHPDLAPGGVEGREEPQQHE